jgi:3-oxoadipate enol-lactonase
MWERQVPALVAAGHRVIVCDLPGHGRAERPARPGSSYTIADLGASVLGTMDEAGVETAAVVGFSLGGAVALWLALEARARVRALGLAATAAWMGPDAPALFGDRAAAVEARGVGVLVQPAIARWFTPAFIEAHDAIVRRYAGWIADNDATGYAAACRSLAGFDVRGRLGEIRCPTLIIVGDRDGATPPDRSQELADGIAGAELRLLAPAGHLLTEERWAEFNRALVEFLGRAPTAFPRPAVPRA